MTDDIQLPTFNDIKDAKARIAGVAVRTPILQHPSLNTLAGATVLVKAECLQTTGSFKIRGAMNRLSRLSDSERGAGVVAFSSGNHAQGVARAARLLGMPALIVMPTDAPQIKIEGVRADGADVRLYERHTENREALAEEIARARGAIVVPSFDDFDIVAGQGTCGLEFAQQAEEAGEPLDHLICCAGGGGLVNGIALAMSELSPNTKIWTAEPDGHDDWKRSIESGTVQANAPGTRSICDAILTPAPGRLTFALGKSLLAGGFTLTDYETKAGMRFAAKQLKVVAEPGGAVALACAVRGLPEEMQGTRVGVVITGGNVDPVQLADILSAES